MSKKITKITIATLGTLLLASCSGGSVQGSAQPTGGSSIGSGASSDSLPPDVPRVPKSLDTSKFEQNPCTALTAPQLQKVGIKVQGEPKQNPNPICWWNDFDAKVSLSVEIATNRDGLAGLYRRQKNFKVFEPLTIEGYPAAIVLTARDERPDGICDIEFAATDKLSISVQTQLDTPDRGSNPCGPTKAAAAEVLKTLKATN
ncbi:Protein of unknown function (DUF3558) [Streptoalloteichus tenebrarius]|uniref:DUF3558 domain-containing protein n=1 Tax=Streptoalloteichus tenebrarius (strain ATCC 17920 / DSM 40477 / JCM 4838 / CBS 697.72 / NBRC 16177 / NCIMB 11028 / NRRL B-12390 / A12253. 1 / ISP 5477) TaxID=1933 RepID=A0ABT1HWY1_STRSD|nr:DUF3558 domain-containing protein [Streptoalloteichus tenebrarius]MCP2260017.1 Protein of unknown function (DUF3558) [Streptoalloteichus tenebrarius]BFF03869.1 hypothetical protein GCM10020241_55440 [Streptoalloteichus tenebrarius]